MVEGINQDHENSVQDNDTLFDISLMEEGLTIFATINPKGEH